MKFQGKFLGATPIKEVGEKGYKVRSFFVDITDNPDYPNTPELNLGGDRVDLVNDLQKGDLIEISINLKGQKYTSKKTGKDAVFTKVEAWRIDKVQDVNEPAAAPQAAAVEEVASEGSDDDLPF